MLHLWLLKYCQNQNCFYILYLCHLFCYIFVLHLYACYMFCYIFILDLYVYHIFFVVYFYLHIIWF